MNNKKVRKVIRKARKVIKVAESCQAEYKRRKSEPVEGPRINCSNYVTGNAGTAKLKRVSMDLTRALSDMRSAR